MTRFENTANNTPPFFSICVPQHNRTSFLIELIESCVSQSFKAIEFCISDGGSTDGRTAELVAYLQATGYRFTLERSVHNLPYDRNLRAAIGLASGRYIVLMGNDDVFNGDDALQRLHDDIESSSFPGVIISDYCDYRSGARAFRIRKSERFRASPRVAAMHFRNFSFVSGIAMDRERAQALGTDAWDGSEMYQTFIGCRMIAAGKDLLERDHQLVRKDVQISGESVDSFATKPVVSPCPLVTRKLPLCELANLVSDAIAPFVSAGDQKQLNLLIVLQLIGLTYPGWLFQYRQVQSWKYAAGIAMGMRPSITATMPLAWHGRLMANMVFSAVTLGGLTIPNTAFSTARASLYRFAKWIR